MGDPTSSAAARQAPPHRGLWLIRSFYFLYYASMAALMPFLVLYYQECGLRGGQIGVLAALPPVLALVGAAAWGGLADASQRHKLVLLVAIAGTALSGWLLSQLILFPLMVAAVVALALFMAPIPALADNTALSLGQTSQGASFVRQLGGCPQLAIISYRSSRDGHTVPAMLRKRRLE